MTSHWTSYRARMDKQPSRSCRNII